VIERRLTALGLETRILQLDGPSKYAVVLLHGNPGSAEDWTDLLKSMVGLGRAVAFDLPGFGQTYRPRAWDYTAASYARFIGATLDALEITRVHLVMHDLGGVGLLWAAGHPDRLASAVLIETGKLIGFRWHGRPPLPELTGSGPLAAILPAYYNRRRPHWATGHRSAAFTTSVGRTSSETAKRVIEVGRPGGLPSARRAQRPRSRASRLRAREILDGSVLFSSAPIRPPSRTDSRWNASCSPSRSASSWSIRPSRASMRRSCPASGARGAASEARLPRPS
jgi:pimeloyl-ACP methyl ester carboxylesterase